MTGNQHGPTLTQRFIGKAHAEAERRYPGNHTADDPFGATGEAQSDEYGYEEYARNAFIAGAEWQASRKVVPTDKMVTRAWRTYHIAIWGDDLDPGARGSSLEREAMRAALRAAQ